MRCLCVMSGSEGSWVLPLAERRELKFPNGESLRTPLVVPSFSSRVADIHKIFRASEEFLDGPYLVSAFDIANGHLKPPFDFAGAVFLDSGGYEIGLGSDLSDVSSEPTGKPSDWTAEQHRAVLDSWSAHVPTVAITYDHPLVRIPISEQIQRAKALAIPPGSARELLIKPETRDQNFIKIDSLVAQVRHLQPFQLVGVTEKEIGNSVFERMVNIARLRLELRRTNQLIPIHVFGSLDTITTLFYFIAGADVFDGLTWLRYAFKDGHTVYRQDYGIGEFGIATKSPKVEALCWSKNHSYMKDMELEMRRFLNAYDFGSYKYHGDALRAAYQSVEEEVR